MDQLAPESRAIYDLLRAETAKEHDARFLDYKKETLDAVHKFVTDTGKQIKTVSAAVDSVRAAVTTDMEEFDLPSVWIWLPSRPPSARRYHCSRV